MGKTVRDHLGFGYMSAKDIKVSIKVTPFGGKDAYIGEHDSNNNLHGKGICIYPSGNIAIGYWDNNKLVLGNYLTIHMDC